jgi:hypothetical protein
MKKRTRRFLQGFLIALAVGYFLTFALKSPEADSGYSTMLLVLSILIEIPAFLTAPRGYALTIALLVTELVKIFFAGLYWRLASLAAEKELIGGSLSLALWGARGAFVCAVLLFVAVFILTTAATAKSSLHKDLKGTLSNTVWALCFTFAAFLHITTFMTFALALYDKGTSGHSLFQTAAFVTPREFEGKIDTTGEEEDDPSVQSTCKSPKWHRVRRFFFAEGKTDLQNMKDIEKKVTPKLLYEKMCGEAEQTSREAYLWTLVDPKHSKHTKEDALLVKAVAWNLRERYEIASLLQELKDKRKRNFDFNVVGHASDTQPELLGNGTNANKADFRAGYVASLVQQLSREVGFREPITKPFGVGSENGRFLEHDHLNKTETEWSDIRGLVPKLSVEVQLVMSAESANETPRKSSLLDYSYFMIYTITTTGYGDLVPSAPFTRFLASIANLFEMFFIVIIFNVILGMREAPSTVAAKAVPDTPAVTVSGNAPEPNVKPAEEV